MGKAIKYPITRVGIGQDSHRFLKNDSSKKCILGNVIFENTSGMDADSDGDVILHSICNAISSLTGVPILGGIAIDLCKRENITDSTVYLQRSLETLGNQTIVHVALTIEGKKPKFQPRIEEIRAQLAKLLNLEIRQIGITATSGDGLTDFARGEGLQCFCIITSVEN